jgi:hypothetical protein
MLVSRSCLYAAREPLACAFKYGDFPNILVCSSLIHVMVEVRRDFRFSLLVPTDHSHGFCLAWWACLVWFVKARSQVFVNDKVTRHLNTRACLPQIVMQGVTAYGGA